MNVTTRDIDGTSVVRLEGRLDTATAPSLETTCSKLIASGAKRIVIDMAQLEYLSSAGLRVMLAVAKQLQAGGGRLTVCGAENIVLETLQLSGIPEIIPVCPTLDDALGED